MAEKKKKRKKWYFTPLFLMLFLLFSINGMPEIVRAEEEIADEDEILPTPEGSYTPEGSSLTYTFTGDPTDSANGFIANITSYRPNAIDASGRLQINSTITYTYTSNDGTVKERQVKVAGILRGVFKGSTTLRSLVLPDSISYIGQEAFSDCINLAEIRTYSETQNPTGLSGYLAASDIEYRAFYGCTALKGITLGEHLEISNGVPLTGVQRVQNEAFMNCSQLSSVEIGPTVNWIEGGAFANCAMLDGLSGSIKIRDNPYYFLQNGILYYRESERSNVLLLCPSGTVVGALTVFPQNVTQIKNAAFYGCTGLTAIEIPDTVVTLGDQAFANCTNLGNVKIPNSVTNIGTKVFENYGQKLCIVCISGSAAERYAISNSLPRSVECTVTFINTYNGEKVVKTVMSGQTIDTPIGWDRDGYVLHWSDNFSSSTVVNENRTISTVFAKLYTVTFRDSNSGKESVANNVEEGTEATPPEWTRKGYRLTWSTENYKRVNADMVVNAIWLVSLTDGVDEEEEQYKKGDFVTIGNVIYKITNYNSKRVRAMALEDDTVTKVTIPATLTFGGRTYQVVAINANAFRGNTYLTKVTIGKNVTLIGHHAFYRCTSLKNIIINTKKLSTVGYYAFKYTKAKAKVQVPTKSLVRTYRMELLDAGLNIKANVAKKK